MPANAQSLMDAPAPPTESAASGGPDLNLAVSGSASAIRAIEPVRPAEAAEIEWNNIVTRATRFLVFQHAFRMATEEGTRTELGGPFLRDYLRSVRGLRGWGDGDPFIVNYIGHPMMGSVTGFIYVQADPRSRRESIGTGRYWKSRLHAMAFSAVYSANFELGPVSEASLGNVGLDRKTMGFTDLVTTPIAGTGWMVLEDAVDELAVERLEKLSRNASYRALVRSFLNPTRSFANIMRGKVPWYRDGRPGAFVSQSHNPALQGILRQ